LIKFDTRKIPSGKPYSVLLIRRVVKFLIVTAFITLLTKINIAQPAGIKFEQLISENTLPSLNINCMIEDKKGFIWIGTNAGLARFDGYKFKIYTNNPHDSNSLSSNQINSLYIDREGILWLATGNGLDKYEKESDNFRSFLIPDNVSTDIDNNLHLFQIFEDDNNLLWISTYNGLIIFNKMIFEFENIFKHIKDHDYKKLSATRFIFQDNKKNLWFFTYNYSIIKSDALSGKLTEYSKNSRYPNGFPGFFGIPMTVSIENILWIGVAFVDRFGSYLSISLGKTGDFYPETIEYKIFSKKDIGIEDTITGRVNTMIEDKNGLLWVGTDNGIKLKEKNSDKFYNPDTDSIRGNTKVGLSIIDIIEDRNGNIWLATEKGIEIYNPGNYKFPVYFYNNNSDEDEEFQKITSIYEKDKDVFWLASTSHLVKWDRKNRLIDKYLPDSLGTRKFRRFLIDSQNTNWLICENSNNLRKYNPDKNEINNFYRHMLMDGSGGMLIKEMFEDSEGVMWLCTDDGLCSFGTDRKLSNRYMNDLDNPKSISHNVVTKMYEDKDGRIWVTTRAGLDRLDKKSNTFTHFKSSELDSATLSNNLVNSFYDDGNGNLWLATFGGGLNRFDKKSEKFICINEEDGFASNFMHHILPDDHGNLWISSNKGISKFNPTTGKINNYNTADGLQGDEFGAVAFKSQSGEMFFGGENGINIFHPDSIRENPNIPEIVLTSFKIFNKEAELKNSITEADEINLSYKDNFFSIEFSALDYTNTKKNQYLYKLDGIDKDWIKSNASKREASYTDIDPGEYTFRVKGSNNDGVWNEKGASVKVIITPPWWKTWWFRGSGIVLIIGLLGYVRQRKLSKIKNELLRQSEFTKQLINTQEAERKRIAGELHDTLGQDLLIIRNKALHGLKNPLKNPELIAEISEISSTSLQEVREISYNLHPYQLEQLGLTKAIESIIERASKSASIKFSYELENIDRLFNPETEINLFRMIQESINNILKHSAAAEASISILKSTDEVSVSIKDNGIGFDILLSGAKRCLGLMSLNERAKISGAKAEIDSRPGKGTLINISISIPKN
jgi:two-component system sensor histidine kinase ChiS